ncbi:iron-containing alcohol dehydrogenase [bacterium]|nr:iron-containing alcohol dehydrogenase [bacterium]
MKDILGKTFTCPGCGQEHTIDTKELIYGGDLFNSLIEKLRLEKAIKNITLIADIRTMTLLGKDVASHLVKAGFSMNTVIVPDVNGHSPQCDDTTRLKLITQIPDCDALLAVGSGVINDLTKWIAHERSLPYFVVATAASMNGYASANVAASLNGVKVLISATAPQYVFASPEIIEQAPAELTSAGLGDALAKPVSTADWKLNNILFNEYFCPFAVEIVEQFESLYFDCPEKINKKDSQTMKALFNALCYSGIAMTIAGTSAPASGGEHLLSHTLDMLAYRDGKEHDLHGRQVGLGTVLSAALYEDVFKQENITWQKLPRAIDENFWGSLSEEVGKHYQDKLVKADQAYELLKEPGKWDEIKKEIQPYLRDAQKIRNCLKEAGAAYRIEDICDLSEEEFTKTWLRSHQMRARFTILDLAFMAGVLPHHIFNLIKHIRIP